MNKNLILCFVCSVLWMGCSKNEPLDEFSLVSISGNNQAGEISTQLMEPLEVQILDERGNLVPNIEISFNIIEGGGTVSNTIVLSDNNGIASVLWTLGAAPTAQIVEISVQNSLTQPISIHATAYLTGAFIDTRDGKEYSTITIGPQTWMAENLTYAAPNSFTYLGFCSGSNYGRYYDWSTLMNGNNPSSPNNIVRGLCPQGWHVPSDNEWNTLEVTLGMDATDTSFFSMPEIGTFPPDTVLIISPQARGNHGRLLKSVGGWNNNPGTNSSGFKAYASGYYEEDLAWASAMHIGCESTTSFWTSTKNSPTTVLIRELNETSNGVFRYDQTIEQAPIFKALPCRCIED